MTGLPERAERVSPTEALAAAEHACCVMTVTQHGVDAHQRGAADLLIHLTAAGYTLVPTEEAGRLREALHQVADLLSTGRRSGAFPTGEAMAQAWNVALQALAAEPTEGER